MNRHTLTSKSGMSFILLLNATIVLLWSFTGTTRVAAQELFVLPTDKGMEFYVVDGQIEVPTLQDNRKNGLPIPLYWSGSLTYNTLSLFQDLRLHIPTFHNMRARLLDPGFRTSLTGRVITIAGRIDWKSSHESVQIAESRLPIEKKHDDDSLGTFRFSPLAALQPDR